MQAAFALLVGDTRVDALENSLLDSLVVTQCALFGRGQGGEGWGGDAASDAI